MNQFDKIRIVAFQGGLLMGYVKSVSYKNGTYVLTKDRMQAKTYAKQESAMKDMDAIAYAGQMSRIMFSMDV